jgi:hypothetical protein
VKDSQSITGYPLDIRDGEPEDAYTDRLIALADDLLQEGKEVTATEFTCTCGLDEALRYHRNACPVAPGQPLRVTGNELAERTGLLKLAEFTPAGTVTGVALVQHPCQLYSVPYVSATPSPGDDPYVVPGCGCRPLPAESPEEKP